MKKRALAGRSILVVEEQLPVACELIAELRAAGAKTYTACRLKDALFLAEHPALSAAVLDFRLGKEDSSAICRRLAHLGIPFMFYSGYADAETDAFHHWADAPLVAKPADSKVVVSTVAGLVH
jgi:DNA-binding response OmpR family regulator